MSFDPANKFLVSLDTGGSEPDRVVVMNPPRRPISKEDALNLAAWILILGNVTDEELAEAVDAIRNM